MAISFGGDPESFMDAPVMQNKGLAETFGGGGGSIIATLLDLVGIHRQVAKGPKTPDEPAATPNPQPQASVPKVLTDVASVLTPQEVPILPITENAPMSSWGQRWLDSMKPLQTIDPNQGR